MSAWIPCHPSCEKDDILCFRPLLLNKQGEVRWPMGCSSSAGKDQPVTHVVVENAGHGMQH